MAIRYVAATVAGVSSTSTNSQSTLATAVADAITAADTANVSNDASTEIAAITTALDALTANQPTGAVVVSVDLAQVTTRAQLRRVLDDVYRYLADSTNLLT